jgi:hypothetical protein
MSSRLAKLLSVGILLAWCAGCGEQGPPRYKLSGTVTFEGEPVPRGSVILEPDPAEGNKGPSVTAEIRDGKYSVPGDRGTVGGPHLVRIVGTDGIPTSIGDMEIPEGAALFPDYTTTADLPAGDATLDFDVEAPAE